MNDILIIMFFAMFVTLSYRIVGIKTTNKNVYNIIRMNIHHYKNQLKTTPKNTVKYYDLKKVLFNEQMKLLKIQMKTSLIMIIPMIIILSALNKIVKNWIWWYLLFSFITSYIWGMLIKKR